MNFNSQRHDPRYTLGYVLNAPRQTLPAEMVLTGSMTIATNGSWKF